MKKIVLLSLLLSITFCLNAGVKIKGEVKNSSEYSKVYLYEYKIDRLILFDSANLKRDKFQFKLDNPELGRYRLGLDRKNAADFVIGGDNIDIETDAADFGANFSIKNSSENQQFDKYLAAIESLDKKAGEVNLKARKIAKGDPKRKEKIAELQTEFNVAKAERNQEFIEIIKNYPNSFAAINAMHLLKVDTIAKNNFFEDYSNSSLYRSNVLGLGLNVYLQRFLNGKPTGKVKRELRSIPEARPEKSSEREATYLALIYFIKGLDAQFAAKIASDYYADFPDNPFEEELREELPALPPDVGDKAPEIALENPEGDIVKLSSTKGKLVLLDFWASWCGPCRRENPNVVRVYNEYKDKGFTVFSVSLDKQAGRWKGAIEKDNLIWDTHVSDLKGWGSKAGKLYGVSSIPSTFLIDQNGVIIAKNLRGHKLENRIKNILGE